VDAGVVRREGGGSPTTVSGIESGRISRPHFGTVNKLARASGVDTGVALHLREPGAPVTALARRGDVLAGGGVRREP
jgi:transcriptional regulator with XRE-family HTH domain